MNEKSLKYRVAKIINAGVTYTGDELPPYEQLLEGIYDHQYKTIMKIPIEVFIMGIIDSFIVKDEQHANHILNIIKEVITEALETSGFELTFVDGDWDELKIIQNTEGKKWKLYPIEKYNTMGKYPNYIKPTGKSYMGEFFEI
jgi:hypothetical protein